MPGPAQARAWWADVEDVRERIEHRRARERQSLAAAAVGSRGAVRAPARRRGVREIRPGRHLAVVPSGIARSDGGVASVPARRRPRPSVTQRVGPRPDRVAAWAVVLGFAMVLAAILSAHG